MRCDKHRRSPYRLLAVVNREGKRRRVFGEHAVEVFRRVKGRTVTGLPEIPFQQVSVLLQQVITGHEFVSHTRSFKG